MIAMGAHSQAEFSQRIMALTDHLAQWSETPTGLTCTYLSKAHRDVAGARLALMRDAGMNARIDAVGNVSGSYRAERETARTVIVGSHYDTVPNGGKYDGRLGIVTALAIVEALSRKGRRLPFNLDVIAFSEEEGVRFARSYIGSSAIAGRFNASDLERRDASGVSLKTALQEAGLNPSTIPALSRAKDDIACYLEVHIEQGPVLFDSNLPVGVVTAIAGNSRFSVTVEGIAGHAGTVPMAYRHDAAAAAAEIVLMVEQRCRHAGLAGTVGQLSVPGGATNVVPGRCDLSLDIRSGADAMRHAAVRDILAEMQSIAQRRGVKVEWTETLNAAAVPCSPQLQDAFAAAIERAGLPVFRLPSGAGNDAVMFGELTDLAMLFVRCGNGGVSHSPLETITAADADIAARILLDVLEHLPD
jgi:N-carbamoyl-L-amino-acid hydrolase